MQVVQVLYHEISLKTRRSLIILRLSLIQELGLYISSKNNYLLKIAYLMLILMYTNNLHILLRPRFMFFTRNKHVTLKQTLFYDDF